MNFFLGLDGGKTKYVLIDEVMNKLYEITVKASNLFAVGISKSSLIITDLTQQVYRSSEINK